MTVTSCPRTLTTPPFVGRARHRGERRRLQDLANQPDGRRVGVAAKAKRQVLGARPPSLRRGERCDRASAASEISHGSLPLRRGIAHRRANASSMSAGASSTRATR